MNEQDVTVADALGELAMAIDHLDEGRALMGRKCVVDAYESLEEYTERMENADVQ